MLVLSRCRSESIVLTDNRTGEQIGRIQVVRIGPHSVRLGLEFPGNINIARDELTEGEDDGELRQAE